MGGSIRGGPRVLSPEFGCGQRGFNQQSGKSNAYRKFFKPPKLRGVPAPCLRLAKISLEIRKGARISGAFCSVRIIRKETKFLRGNKKPSGDDKRTCWASQTVKVTVNAMANPVHVLLSSLVILGRALCTNRALACLMPRGFWVISTLS